MARKKTIARYFSIVKVVLHIYTETVSYFVAPYHITVEPVFKHLVQKCRLDVASILKGESLAFYVFGINILCLMSAV